MKLSRIKFGRIPHFDRRSRKFPIRALLGDVRPRSYTWACNLWLDQGSAPACVGFSVTAEAAAKPCPVPNLSNEIAMQVYKRAKKLDEFPGEFYDGSSVLGGMKAGTERGWYQEYRWAFGLEDLALAIGHHGPAVIGVNWYSDMMTPDSKGLIKVGGNSEGGHAILVVGVSLKTGLYRLHNSWSKEWGVNGDCFLSAQDMGRLLDEKGEAAIPVIRKKG